MCSPIALGVASFATGAMGAVGQHQSASAQASAANAAATSNYKYQLKVRERAWDRERHVYGRKLFEHDEQLKENNLAAQRAYSGEQRKLNEAYRQAAFSNQAMVTQLLGMEGKGTAARGMTGRTADRMDASQLAAFGRNQAILAQSLTSARQAGEFRKDSIRRELKNTNRQAYSEVAIAPTPGVAPPPPTMQPGPSGLGLLAGLGSAAVDGYGTYNQLKAPPAYV